MKPSIILIEDDLAVNEALCIILNRSGYDVTPIIDDRDFVINKHSIPDMYIIDRHLSGVDGLELCRRIKAMPATMHIPVVIISAAHDIEKLAYSSGADVFLEKPFSKRRLIETMEQFLQKAY